MPKVKKKLIVAELEPLTGKKFDIQDKPEYKCFHFFDNDPFHYKIFKELGKISKNIYNTTVYSIQVFNYFKIELYKNLYTDLIKDNNINISEYINSKLINYFNLYSSLKDKLTNNNNYIYKYIINYINTNKIIIKNSNYTQTIDTLFDLLVDDMNIYMDNINDDLLFDQIVTKIVNSIYTKNYIRTKNEILNHKECTIKDTEIFEDIKNNKIYDFSTKNIYKPKINDILRVKYAEELKKDPDFIYEVKSDQNYIGRLVYANLGYNDGKLDTTMIGSIIARAYQAYTSYFALLQKGIKAKHPKFLKKDDIYNLIYAYSKAIKKEDSINVYTSTYISKNFEQFGDQYLKLSNNKYIDNKYLLNVKNKKILKKDNYIINNKYIPKDDAHIIDVRYITIPLPKKAENLKIKVVEIVFMNNTVKICMTYETSNKKVVDKELTKEERKKLKKLDVKKEIIINPEESISIDLGVKNLLTIYNPTGKQNIVDGKFISSINSYYNYKISKAQSKNDDNLFHKLHLKRKNIINNYFNIVVKWMEKEYSNKKLIILGYNQEWKQGSNLGKENNRKFHSITYMSLINKIRTKFIENNKIVILTEESYTSKCDSLAMEKICFHEAYLGNRSKRGLFESSTNKLINADINGAINILRKVLNGTADKVQEIVQSLSGRCQVKWPVKTIAFTK
jgi:IS605 OrfB family transposase